MKRKNDILVSAIISTYGRDYEIMKRSIISVLNQTYSNIEIIVVNDNPKGSEHHINIEKNIKKKHPHIIYISHDKNCGAQISRNDGIRAAKGELFAFLDDDDEWLPTKIEKQVALYQSEDKVGVIYCKGYTYYEDTNTKIPYYNAGLFKAEATFKDLLYEDIIGTTTQAVISRRAIEEVGNFDVNQPARQDYEMWIRISQKYRCLGVDDYLFIHYMHDGTQISKDPYKAITGYINILNKYHYYYSRYIKAKLFVYNLIRKKYLEAGDEKQARHYKFLIFVNKIKGLYKKVDF